MMKIQKTNEDGHGKLSFNEYSLNGYYVKKLAPNYIDKEIFLVSDIDNEDVDFWEIIQKINVADILEEVHLDIMEDNSITEKLPYPFTGFQIGKKVNFPFIRFQAITQRGYQDEKWNKKWAVNFFFNACKKFENKPNVKVLKSSDEDDFWSLDIEIKLEVIDNLDNVFSLGLEKLKLILKKVELSLEGFDEFLNIVEIWDKHKNEKSEKFWQKILKENSWIISLAFNQPLFLLQNEGYLGGKNIGNLKGKVVDFIYKNKLTNNIALIEIKTPISILMGRKYRETYALSREITGSINQILRYRDILMKEFYTLKANSNEKFEFFNTKGILIIGRVDKLNVNQKRAFELFRNELKNIEILGFDELFEKVFMLLNLMEI